MRQPELLKMPNMICFRRLYRDDVLFIKMIVAYALLEAEAEGKAEIEMYAQMLKYLRGAGSKHILPPYWADWQTEVDICQLLIPKFAWLHSKEVAKQYKARFR